MEGRAAWLQRCLSPHLDFRGWPKAGNASIMSKHMIWETWIDFKKGVLWFKVTGSQMRAVRLARHMYHGGRTRMASRTIASLSWCAFLAWWGGSRIVMTGINEIHQLAAQHWRSSPRLPQEELQTTNAVERRFGDHHNSWSFWEGRFLSVIREHRYLLRLLLITQTAIEIGPCTDSRRKKVLVYFGILTQ